jgi:ABC-type transport system involved in multi-copper enzyme maturation permease subunit
VFTIAHALVAWRLPTARWLSLGAFLALIANLAVFFAYTYPINVLTQSWTVPPENLEIARRQWEYSHAINAGFVLLALALIVSAVLASSYASGMANRGSDAA